MDARAPRLTNWDAADLSPASSVDDVRLVLWSSKETFRRARAEWLHDIHRFGGPKFARMQMICSVVASYMSPDRDGAWPSIDRLAAELDWSRSTVKRALALAEEWGWLQRTRRFNRTTIYEMSFSVSVRDDSRQRVADRLAVLADRRATDRVIDSGSNGLRPEPINGSDLNPQWVQSRPSDGLTPEPLSCPENQFHNPAHRSNPSPLGEREQDIGEGDEQKKAALDDVISALGGGDFERGQRIAESLNPARLDWIVSLVDQNGMVGAHRAIVEARNSVSLSN
jgi:hypothetical protein